MVVRTAHRSPDRERGGVGAEEQEDKSDVVIDQKVRKRKCKEGAQQRKWCREISVIDITVPEDIRI